MHKVCHISTVHRITDTRVFYKECVSMAKYFDLSLIITHDKKEVIDGVKVIPLPKSRGRLHRLVIKTTLAFFKALRSKAKICHIHDPELIIVGILLRLFGKKVVYDMHELVYYQITDKKWLGPMWFRKFVAGFYKIFESIAIRIFSQIAIAEKGYFPYFEKHYPKRLKKVMFIRNFPILSMIDEQETHDYKTDKTTLIYVGGLTRIRGIKELSEGVKAAKSNVQLVLLGPWESDAFKEECLSNNNRVIYEGMRPLNEVFPFVKGADIGCALLHPLQNHINSSLIKTYEYMACSLPMILSDFDTWKEEFGDFSIFCDPLNIDQIANTIDCAVQHSEEMKQKGELGRTEVIKKYSWETEEKRIKEMYDSLI